MRYDIILAPAAIEDLEALSAHERAKVKQALSTYLRHDPTKVSKSRIKRLQGMSQPQFRLRVDEIRVYYDVEEPVVFVLAIVPKAEAGVWLAQEGVPDETDSPFGREG